jgi:hypothetical protein
MAGEVSSTAALVMERALRGHRGQTAHFAVAFDKGDDANMDVQVSATVQASLPGDL